MQKRADKILVSSVVEERRGTASQGEGECLLAIFSLLHEANVMNIKEKKERERETRTEFTRFSEIILMVQSIDATCRVDRKREQKKYNEQREKKIVIELQFDNFFCTKYI